MSQSVITLLRDGQDYMNTWPVKRELYAFFPECRVVSATKLAIKAMPPLAIVAAGMMLNVLGSAYLPQAMAIGLFFISLPLQGLLWLGHPRIRLCRRKLKVGIRKFTVKWQQKVVNCRQCVLSPNIVNWRLR